MIFLGNAFCAADHSLDATSTNINSINYLEIANGEFDQLYVSKNGSIDYTTTIPAEWDYNTIMNALFDGNLNAGNILYALSQMNSIRIKRRIKGTFEWITLFEVPVSQQKDAQFDRYDKYARAGQEYDYAVVPTLNGIEGNLNISSIVSQFDGIFVIEKDSGYSTEVDVDVSPEQNKPSGIIEVLGEMYPYAVSNGNINYASGSATGTFFEIDYDKCTFDLQQSGLYRKKLAQFLQNGNSKILKLNDGRMWLVAVIGNVNDSKSAQNGLEDYTSTTFSWAEIDDCESSNALYNNGFIDVNVEGR